MYIYHYAHWRNLESIQKHGLTYRLRNENWNDTIVINYALEKVRPSHLPSFINRDKCVFFHPTNMWKCGVGDIFYRVNINRLDPERLYLASFEDAQEIYEGNIPEYYASSYWDSLIPFSKELVSTLKDEDKQYEVLYFGEVPFSDIETGCFIDPKASNIISRLSKEFETETWSARFYRILLNDVYYNIHFNSKGGVVVTTEDGAFDSSIFSSIEKYISYKSKSIIHNKTLKVTYQNVFLV